MKANNSRSFNLFIRTRIKSSPWILEAEPEPTEDEEIEEMEMEAVLRTAFERYCSDGAV